ncbi:PorP/SprF family type IX secretion system membrane protein [Psychroserpens damuponensis]|uniref:PorP/SprF family type IX secretion system membrane protein n=1 Tax=Psychroserpens damuponensis TaxID=943936 RepID=UPI00059136F0|nr:PorP/SprF family type IX secretion system membrane protein [Psychroserpens damuponensis]
MNLKHTIIFALVFMSCTVNAQDPIFTQSNNMPITLNPGFTGFEDNGRVYAGMLSRMQWPGLDLNINTQYAFVNQSFEGNRLAFGVGINAHWQRESFNNYNFFQFNVNYAQRFRIADQWYFRPGIEVGVGNKNNRFRNLTLGDQLNINTGVINPVSVDPLGNNTRNFFFMDFSTGVVFERIENNNDISYWFGASAKHINRPDVSFVEGENSKLDMLISLHATYRFPFLNDDSKVLITTNYLRQGQFDRLDLGPLFQLDQFLVGVTAATNPAKNSKNRHLVTSVNGFLGMEYSSFRFGVSYDHNVSKIGNTGGVYEFSLTFLSECKYCKRNRQRKR